MHDSEVMVTTLEMLVDGSSLADVMAALSEVCSLKAEHLRSNWQDGKAARAWDNAAGHVGVCATNRYVDAVSTISGKVH